MAIETVGDLVGFAKRTHGSLQAAKESKKKLVERAVEMSGGLTGAGLSGLMRGLGVTTIPKTSIPVDAGLGLVSAGLGLADIGDGTGSDFLVALGIGLSAPYASRSIEKIVFDFRAKK